MTGVFKMPISRREFVTTAAAVGMGSTLTRVRAAEPAKQRTSVARNRFAVATYSFWQFRPERVEIETCLDAASEMGLDGVEILHRQMKEESNGYLQRLKRQAFSLGLDLCGFSTHQGFLFPDKAERKKNIDHTLHCIELAYRLGIPTMRVNTGRWGTIKDFDDLMKARGIEPRLDGYTDDDGFGWVIDSLEKCLPKAEECGVVPDSKTTLGLGRTPEGVMRIVDAIDSPDGMEVTLDTGNFLGELLREARPDRTPGDTGAGKNVLRRRQVVYARSRLPADCTDAQKTQIPWLCFARIRRQ